MSELGGAQMSTLLESLPGIANVLRSPVADALVGVIRSAARIEEFELADAKELLQYASRRGLLAEDECVRILQDVERAYEKRRDRAAGRAKRAKAKPAAKKKAAKKAAPKKTSAKKPSARAASRAKPKKIVRKK